jgi:hypothetical protein
MEQKGLPLVVAALPRFAGAVRNSQNETIVIDLVNAGDQYFNLNLPFVPDLIEVQLALCGLGGTYNHNVLSARSNMFGGDVLALCNRDLSFTPVYRYYNPQRQNFMGSYSIRLVDEEHNASLNNGVVAVLRFQFIRYE